MWFALFDRAARVAGWCMLPIYNSENDYQVEQTIELSAGWNWWSTNLIVDLGQLKTALEAALEGTTVMIKAQNGSFLTYANGTWRGTLTSIDVTKMYKIQTSAACEITLSGTLMNPSEHSITINSGNNWIGFPMTESMSLSAAFGTFPVQGDMVKYKSGSATYVGTMWRGDLQNLVPGRGYIYKSDAAGVRTFYFPSR